MFKLILSNSFCLLACTLYSQNIKSCFQLQTLINYPEILKNFRLSDAQDSLILIDKQNIVSYNCINLKWGNKNLQVIHDTLNTNAAVRGSSAVAF